MKYQYSEREERPCQRKYWLKHAETEARKSILHPLAKDKLVIVSLASYLLIKAGCLGFILLFDEQDWRGRHSEVFLFFGHTYPMATLRSWKARRCILYAWLASVTLASARLMPMRTNRPILSF